MKSLTQYISEARGDLGFFKKQITDTSDHEKVLDAINKYACYLSMADSLTRGGASLPKQNVYKNEEDLERLGLAHTREDSIVAFAVKIKLGDWFKYIKSVRPSGWDSADSGIGGIIYGMFNNKTRDFDKWISEHSSEEIEVYMKRQSSGRRWGDDPDGLKECLAGFVYDMPEYGETIFSWSGVPCDRQHKRGHKIFYEWFKENNIKYEMLQRKEMDKVAVRMNNIYKDLEKKRDK